MPNVDVFLYSFSGGRAAYFHAQFLPIRSECQNVILPFEQGVEARVSLEIVCER
jgi:hypothetical protein